MTYLATPGPCRRRIGETERVRLLSLDLENYRQHRATTLQFVEGLTGIVGPNGSGKSTILEAIAWTIYGAAAVRSRGKVEGLLHQHATGKEELRAVLEFELDGHHYRVERTIKAAAVYRDGAALAHTTRGVTEALTATLGLDYPAFFTSYFTAQNELDFLANLQAARRKDFVGRLLGLDALAAAQRRARTDAAARTREAQGLAAGIGDLDALERSLGESQTELERTGLAAEAATRVTRSAEEAHAAADGPWREAVAAEREHHRITRELERVRSTLERHAERDQRNTADLESARAAAGELQRIQAELDRRPAAEAELARQEELARDAVRRADLERARERARRALAREQEKFAAASLALQGSPAPAPGVAELTARREELLRVFQAASQREARREAERQGLERAATELEGRLARLASGDGTCPLCGQPLRGEHGDATEHLRGELSAVRAELARRDAVDREEPVSSGTIKAQGQQVREALERAEAQERARQQAAAALEVAHQAVTRQESEVRALERDLADLPREFDATAHERARRDVARLGELAGMARSLAERAARIREFEALRAELVTARAGLEREAAELTRALQAAGHDDARLATLAAAELAARSERDRARQERDRADGARRAAEGVHAERHDRVREARGKRERLTALRQEVLTLVTLGGLLGELRDRLSTRIGPELAGAAGTLLAQLTEGRYREVFLDEDFEVSLESEGGLFPLSRFSGGEQDVANLALRLAISEQITARTGRRLELLILDEVFGSLDEQRREQALDVLRSLTNRYRQVILITHVDGALRDCDHVFRLAYDDASRSARVAAA
jgi:exonuclease SbcC